MMYIAAEPCMTLCVTFFVWRLLYYSSLVWVESQTTMLVALTLQNVVSEGVL